MVEMKSPLKEVLPFLSITCALFVYIEEYTENTELNLWISCFAISKAVWAEICAFTTWKGLYYFKLVENEIFDLLVIHVFLVPTTMVIMLPSLYWALKLSLVTAIILSFLVIRLLLGRFKQFKQLEISNSKAYRRSVKLENSPMRNLPRTIFKKEMHKTPISKVNVPIPNGASGDGALLNSLSSPSTEPPKRTSGRSEYLPGLLNSTPIESMSKSQELRKARTSKATQAGASTTSMVESSTTTASLSSWNPLAIENREDSRCNSTRTDSLLSQNSQMSTAQVSVSTQASSLTPTSWKVWEYKIRNGKVYKAILYNEKAGISRPIDPDILYDNGGKTE